MWCSVCNKSYSDEDVCPKCGETLKELPQPEWVRSGFGALLESWPKDGSGEHIPPAYLTHCSATDYEAEAVVSMLRAYGIPSIRDYPNNGQFGQLILGTPGTGIDLYVPATMLEDAKALLEGETDYDDNEV